MAVTASLELAGFGLGIALAGAPGPVQALLLAEAVRGGMARGLRVMLGANLTFGLLLVGVALGLSLTPPDGGWLRSLKLAGGAFLLWAAVDGLRARQGADQATAGPRTLPPAVRGSLAVLLNPGAWLFIGTAASSLLSSAGRQGGRGSGIAVALALWLGLAIGDGSMVLLGGIGVRRAGERAGLWVRRALAIVLAGLGAWLLAGAVMG